MSTARSESERTVKSESNLVFNLLLWRGQITPTWFCFFRSCVKLFQEIIYLPIILLIFFPSMWNIFLYFAPSQIPYGTHPGGHTSRGSAITLLIPSIGVPESWYAWSDATHTLVLMYAPAEFYCWNERWFSLTKSTLKFSSQPQSSRKLKPSTSEKFDCVGINNLYSLKSKIRHVMGEEKTNYFYKFCKKQLMMNDSDTTQKSYINY